MTTLFMGCAGTDLSAAWQLDRLRVLGLRAIPAEPAPGQFTTFESLIYTPDEMTVSVVWFACLSQSADAFGCEIDDSELSNMEDAEIEDLIDAGFIGFEPGFPPTWVPPTEALDDLSEEDKLEGENAIVNIIVSPDGGDEDDALVAFKRLVVSLAETPNHNPEVTGITLEGKLMPDGSPLLASPGQSYTLVPNLAPDAIEDYTFINTAGESEQRTEEPYFTWYTDGGEFDQAYSLYPSMDVEWTAPESAEPGTIIVVMRDRRGGMAWHKIDVVYDSTTSDAPDSNEE